jgi:hypothetical protein
VQEDVVAVVAIVAMATETTVRAESATTRRRDVHAESRVKGSTGVAIRSVSSLPQDASAETEGLRQDAIDHAEACDLCPRRIQAIALHRIDPN